MRVNEGAKSVKKVRVGIIGTGNISEAHVDGYKQLKDVEIAAACDIDREKLTRYANTHGIPNTFTDYNEMLAMADLDAVSVCTWNCAHAPVAIAALRAGKHVLCEKPLAMTVAEAQGMEREALKAGRVLSVGVVMRFERKADALRDLIRAGRLGDIFFAKTLNQRRAGSPVGWFTNKAYAGGGPMIDLGVHIIDICRYLMGNPKPVAVSGATFGGLGLRSNIKGIARYVTSGPSDVFDIEDLAVAMIRFENGSVLQVETSYSQHVGKEDYYNLSLYGTKGGCDYEPRLSVYSEMDDYLMDITPQFSWSEYDAFRREIAHFVDCVRGEAQSIAPASDGVEIMKILCGVYESAQLGHEITIR